MLRGVKRSSNSHAPGLNWNCGLRKKTVERDDVARDDALAELDRTNARLEERLAERTIERDDVARDDAIASLVRTNSELKIRLAQRTIERDELREMTQ